MRHTHPGWLVVGLLLVMFCCGCQRSSPPFTPTPEFDPSPVVERVDSTSTPAVTETYTPQATESPTTPPTLNPTPQPVYVPITNRNAGRLAEVKGIDFGPWAQIISLEWAPDGRFLAVSTGNQLALVDVQNWQTAVQVELNASTPGLGFSPDSRNLAAAGRDGRLTVWEIGEREPVTLSMRYSLEAHRKGANQVKFSPDGLWLASGGNDGLAKVWQMEDGKLINQIIGGSFAVADLAFSPDGSWLAIVNSNLIRMRKPESGVMGMTLQAAEPLFCVDFSPDGRWLAAGDSANQVLLWDLETGSPPRLVGEHGGRPGRVEALVWQVDFDPTGGLLASAGGEGMVRVWDVSAGQPLAALHGHGGAATSASFSPDGLWLATGDLDGRLRIWGVLE